MGYIYKIIGVALGSVVITIVVFITAPWMIFSIPNYHVWIGGSIGLIITVAAFLAGFLFSLFISRKYFIAHALSIGILASLFACAALFFASLVRTPTYEGSAIPLSLTQPAAIEDMKNWQTYRNEKYGFEFKYPKDWFFEPKDNSFDNAGFLDLHLTNYKVEERADCNKFVGMEIQVGHPLSGSFDELVKSQVNAGDMGPSGKIVSIVIGGHAAYKIDQSGWNGGCGGPGYFIKMDDNRYIYIFTGYGKDDDQKFINQILSTFKFINP